MTSTAKSRSFGLLALLFAAAGGCAPTDLQGEPIPGDDRAELYQGSGVTLWPKGVAPVCYSTTDGNNQSLLTQAQNIVNVYGWPAVANVSFPGWAACGANPSPSSGQIRIHFASGSNGNTSREGAGGSQFTDVTLANDATAQHFQYEVLHELGHALGWDHEQQRPDNYPTGPSGAEKYCTKNQVGQGEDQTGTDRTSYFDTQSIMSYCTGWSWMLSPGDVAGVQDAYGLRTPTVNGQNSSNAAASRTANNLDTFFAHNDGSIWTSYWYNGLNTSSWPTFQLPGAGPGTAPKWAPIATVSRSASNLDLFYVSPTGAINTSYWYSTSGWGSTVLPGTAGLATPGAQIAAVSSSPGALDVLYAGKDKNLYWSHWSGQCSGSATQCGWQSPVKVVSNGTVPVGAAITAVARTADRLDVFYIESDGVPHTSACYGFGASGAGSCTAGNWSNFKLATSASCAATPGGNIAATARTANNIDIFYVNKQEAICTSYWSPVAGWNSFPLTANNTLASWSSIAAVTRTPGNLDLFWMGTNAQGTGEMHTAFWAAGGSWGQIDLGGPYGGVGIPGGVMGAAARTSNNLDIFAPGVLLFTNQFTSLTTSYWYTGARNWTTYQNDSY